MIIVDRKSRILGLVSYLMSRPGSAHPLENLMNDLKMTKQAATSDIDYAIRLGYPIKKLKFEGCSSYFYQYCESRFDAPPFGMI